MAILVHIVGIWCILVYMLIHIYYITSMPTGQIYDPDRSLLVIWLAPTRAIYHFCKLTEVRPH